MFLRPKPEKEAAANALGRKRLDKKYVIAILLLAIAVFVLVKVEYDIQQDREEEELLESLTTDGYLVYGADNSAPPLRYVDADSEKELSDINSMRVATQKGDYANEYLQENYPQAELVYVKNVQEIFARTSCIV